MTRARGYIEDYRPHEATKRLLGDVMAVLEEYEEYQPLTCRQVFYRLLLSDFTAGRKNGEAHP